MSNRVRWLVFALVVGAAAAGWHAWRRSDPAPPAVARSEAPARSEPAVSPQIRFPLPQRAETPVLPSLDQSDSSMREQIVSLVGAKGFDDFFHPKDLVRRIVATIDNLPREKLAVRLLPVKTVGGLFATSGPDANRTIGEGNPARYAAYLRMVESVDADRLVALYIAHYSLFQQAYRDLGYPDGYFNDRLVEVIDHLLAAPDIDGPIRLEQRKVLYEFADPELEARSAGQKILMRIGAGNGSRIKAKLREIRTRVTAPARKQ